MLVVVLPLICEAFKIGAAQDKTVHVIFIDDACDVHGVRATSALRGYLWNADTHCERGDTDQLYAMLRIVPRNLSNWFVIVDFTLLNTQWRPTKLLDLIGPEVTLTMNGKAFAVMNDSAFPEQIGRLTACEGSEFKSREVCYDTCDEIVTNASAVPTCVSNLWFHSLPEAGLYRYWKKIDGLRCHMGYWMANWYAHGSDVALRGSQRIESSHEVQCSTVEPDNKTSKFRMVLGFGLGGGALFIIAAIAFFCWRYKPLNRGTETHSTSLQEKPRKKKKKVKISRKSNRTMTATDIERLHTEKFSTKEPSGKPSTPGVYSPPPGDGLVLKLSDISSSGAPDPWFSISLSTILPVYPCNIRTQPLQCDVMAETAGPPLPNGFASALIA
ncbi:hypothetical protein PRIPAC_94658 [Pristionchus pacificus]|nr:hypothetical protein PRIPAC_94658 [Pristionchus pacificus]